MSKTSALLIIVTLLGLSACGTEYMTVDNRYQAGGQDNLSQQQYELQKRALLGDGAQQAAPEQQPLPDGYFWIPSTGCDCFQGPNNISNINFVAYPDCIAYLAQVPQCFGATP